MTTANEQAVEDFNGLIGKINRTKSDAEEVIRNIEEIEKMAKNILDDSSRKAELKKIVDVYPNITMTKISNDIKDLKAIKEAVCQE